MSHGCPLATGTRGDEPDVHRRDADDHSRGEIEQGSILSHLGGRLQILKKPLADVLMSDEHAPSIEVDVEHVEYTEGHDSQITCGPTGG